MVGCRALLEHPVIRIGKIFIESDPDYVQTLIEEKERKTKRNFANKKIHIAAFENKIQRIKPISFNL